MSLIIRDLSADYSNSPLPKLVSITASAWPSDGYIGVWRLTGGTVDATASSSYVADDSQQRLRLKDGWPAPTQKSYGLDIPAGAGSVYLSEALITPSWTVMLAAKHTMTVASGIGYPCFVGRDADIAAAGDPITNRGPAINANLAGGPTLNTWGHLNTTINVRDALPSSVGSAAGVLIVTYDGAAGVLTFRDHAGRTATIQRSNLIGLYNGAATDGRKWAVGCWPTATFGTAVSAQIYGWGLWSRPLQVDDQSYLVQQAVAMLAARGVAVGV